MGKMLVRYRWEYFCPIRKKKLRTRAHFPEDLIKHEHPDAVPIEGTRIEYEQPDNPMEGGAGGILRGLPPMFSAKMFEMKKKPPGKDG